MVIKIEINKKKKVYVKRVIYVLIGYKQNNLIDFLYLRTVKQNIQIIMDFFDLWIYEVTEGIDLIVYLVFSRNDEIEVEVIVD